MQKAIDGLIYWWAIASKKPTNALLWLEAEFIVLMLLPLREGI